jgi:hypothetical protein
VVQSRCGSWLATNLFEYLRCTSDRSRVYCN